VRETTLGHQQPLAASSFRRPALAFNSRSGPAIKSEMLMSAFWFHRDCWGILICYHCGGGIFMGWSNIKQQALKILGDGAEVPDLPDSVDKAMDNWDKAYVAFKAARDDCEKALLETDNANSAHMNALQQFRARIEKNNFKLDDKKDAKKIQQVQKLLTAAIDEGIKSDKTNDKAIDELERHLVQLGKYKQSSSSL
jgi:hypothetical protein